MLQSKCALCDETITDGNNSGEHIIANAIGGRRKVYGFICKPCNDTTGDCWDSVLAREARPLCLLLNVKRQNGETPRQEFETISGKKVILHPDGTMNYADISKEKIEKDGKTYLHVNAQTMKQARTLLGFFKKEHPDLDIDKVMEQFEVKQTYSGDPLKMSFCFSEPEIERSNVKSVLAFAASHKVDVHSCKQAIGFLTDEKAAPCLGGYYGKDVLLDRPADTVFHAVAIHGDPETGLLMGYMELFSAHRVLMCLSEAYTGEKIHEIYSINPLTSEELDLHFELPFTRQDIADLYQGKFMLVDVMHEAMRVPLGTARKIDLERSVNRAISEAVEYGFKNCGAEWGAILTPEQFTKMSQLSIDRLTPFLRSRMP